MGGDSRFNLLLTHEAPSSVGAQPWYQTLSHLLAPLGVRTFDVTSGQAAVEVIERNSIHLAVVDSRLPAISGLNVLRLIQKLREQPGMNAVGVPAGGASVRVEMRVEERSGMAGMHRRIEVKFDSRQVQAASPVVILITPPQQDDQLLQEALKFNAFSVLSEPVDVNLILDVMARALKRFHQNQWPQ